MGRCVFWEGGGGGEAGSERREVKERSNNLIHRR